MPRIEVLSGWNRYNDKITTKREVEMIVEQALGHLPHRTRVKIVTGVHTSPSDARPHIRVDVANDFDDLKAVHIYVMGGPGFYQWDRTTPTFTSNLHVGINQHW